MAEISLTGDQMLTVLETIARTGPLTAAEVARSCHINRTVAYRLLSTLAQRAYVRRGPDGYSLGSALVELARHLEWEISKIALPHMQRLAERVGETVVLHGLDNEEAVVVEQAVAERHLVRVQHSPGTRHPLFLGASGWSLLAFQDDRTIARVLKRAPDPQVACERIATARASGYAVSHDELQLGVHGIAAPLFNRSRTCVATLGILVPTGRSSGLAGFAQPLLETADAISGWLARSEAEVAFAAG